MVTLSYTLDMYPRAVPVVVHLNQYDSDFELVFTLMTSCGTFNIQPGTTAEIRGTKSDGNGYSANCTIDIANSKVTVAGHNQMTAASGKNTYELVLKKNDKVLSTANFILWVEPAAMDAGTITSDTVLKELNAIIESASIATEAAEDASDAADRAEAAAETLEIDATLTQAGQAADAKKTGDEISDLKSAIDEFEPLSDDIKTALLACFERVMWIDNTSGQSTYNDLYNAFYGETPVIEPSYDFEKMEYDVGGGGPAEIYQWSGNTRAASGYRLFSPNDMTNRARMRTFMPAVSGTITAMSGYEVVAYLFDSIQFASSLDYNTSTDTRNKFGQSGGVNFNSSYPSWGSSFTIEDSDCKYVYLCFRKTSNADWTQTELQNMYGTVFTASLSPSYKLFDIAQYTGGYTYGDGDIVKDELVTDGGMSHKRRYIRKSAVSARATVDYLPITKGIFRSADPTKYQICLYQIDSEGGCIWDTENPYISESNGFPAWADEFDLSLNPKNNEVFCICISFKKLDGTDFTANELSNMYGTVFTYSEEE